MSVSVEISRIQAEALKIDPARVLAWLFALPFLTLGFAARIVWVAIALAIASSRAGWQSATVQLEAWQKRGSP